MSSTAGKIVRSLSFTRRKKTQQMGSAHLEEDGGGEAPSTLGVRSVAHQAPSGAQGVGRRVSGAASSAGAVVRSLSFTRRKKKTSDSGVPGQPHAAAAWHDNGGNGTQYDDGAPPPMFNNVTTHNDFRGAGEAEGSVHAAEREVQRQEQEDYDLALAMSMSMASLEEQQTGGSDQCQQPGPAATGSRREPPEVAGCRWQPWAPAVACQRLWQVAGSRHSGQQRPAAACSC